MQMPDVNILVYAHREETQHHQRYAGWLTDLARGPNHWGIFRRLCESGNLQGKIVADAAHAALAIESGCEWVTADTDFARFSPPLRWRHL